MEGTNMDGRNDQLDLYFRGGFSDQEGGRKGSVHIVIW